MKFFIGWSSIVLSLLINFVLVSANNRIFLTTVKEFRAKQNGVVNGFRDYLEYEDALDSVSVGNWERVNNDEAWEKQVTASLKKDIVLLRGDCQKVMNKTTADEDEFKKNFPLDLMDEKSKDLLCDARYDKVIIKFVYTPSKNTRFVIIFRHRPVYEALQILPTQNIVLRHVCNMRADLFRSEYYTETLAPVLSTNLNQLAEHTDEIPASPLLAVANVKFENNDGPLGLEIMKALYLLLRTEPVSTEEHNKETLLRKTAQRMGVFVDEISSNIVIVVESFDAINFRGHLSDTFMKLQRKYILIRPRWTGKTEVLRYTDTDATLNKTAEFIASKFVMSDSNVNTNGLRGIFRQKIFNRTNYSEENFQSKFLLELLEYIIQAGNADDNGIQHPKHVKAGIGFACFTDQNGKDYWNFCALFEREENGAEK